MANFSEKLIVTAVKYQKHNKEKVSIFVNDKYYDSLFDMVYANSSIKIGAELDTEEFARLKSQSEGRLAFGKAIDYIGHRVRSEKEVTDYLSKKEFEESAIEYAIAKLKDYNYLDDKKFSISFVRDSQKLKRYGRIRIRYELRQKGVEQSIIDEVMEEEYDLELEYENAIALVVKLQKKHRKESDDFKRKGKITNSMANKGYNYDTIRAAIDETENI